MTYVIALTVDVLCCVADRVVTIHMTTSGPQTPSLVKAQGTLQHRRDCGHGVPKAFTTFQIVHIANCTLVGNSATIYMVHPTMLCVCCLLRNMRHHMWL
jgi:hypothetical protein